MATLQEVVSSVVVTGVATALSIWRKIQDLSLPLRQQYQQPGSQQLYLITRSMRLLMGAKRLGATAWHNILVWVQI